MNKEQLGPEEKIRSVLGFILFDNDSHLIKNNETITFAQLVRDVFKNWINRENNWIVTHTYNELPNELDNEIIVFWKKDRIRFSAALFLYTIIPFYKLRKNKKDKHGELILELLDSLIDGKEFNKQYFQDCDLTYYWHHETASYLYKSKQIMDMSDETFKNLEDFDTWLNDFT